VSVGEGTSNYSKAITQFESRGTDHYKSVFERDGGESEKQVEERSAVGCHAR